MGGGGGGSGGGGVGVRGAAGAPRRVLGVFFLNEPKCVVEPNSFWI